jgi:hypothetical protein
MQRLKGGMTEKLIKKIQAKTRPFFEQPRIAEYYPFVFYQPCLGYNNNIKNTFHYTIGKRENGSLDVLYVHINDEPGFYGLKTEPYSFYKRPLRILQDIGIKRIDTFVLSNKIPNTFIEIKAELGRVFPGIDIQWGTPDFFKKMKISGLQPPEISQFESIFFLRSKSEASDVCDRFAADWASYNYIPPRAKYFLDSISYIYKYHPEDRMIVASANIIVYIHKIVQILMDNKEWLPLFGKVIADPKILVQGVLENGAGLIPFWPYFIKPI